MKSTNKDSRITVRLTPNQDFMLDAIAKKINKPKSAIIRYILEQFITKYNDTVG